MFFKIGNLYRSTGKVFAKDKIFIFLKKLENRNAYSFFDVSNLIYENINEDIIFESFEKI